LIDALCPPDRKPEEAPAAARLRIFYEDNVRPFLVNYAGPAAARLAYPSGAAEGFDELRQDQDVATLAGEQLMELQELCARRRQLAEQSRLYRWLHLWLLLHVPLSVALLVLGVAHVVMSLYY